MVTSFKKGAKLNKQRRERKGSIDHPSETMDSMQSLMTEVREAVESYFELSQLRSDAWLQSHMDSEGFIPLSLLASFEKLRSLTGVDCPFIERALQDSDVVELVTKDSGHCFVRRRIEQDVDDEVAGLCEITNMSVDSSIHSFRPRHTLHEIRTTSPSFSNDLVATSLPAYCPISSTEDSWRVVSSRRSSIFKEAPIDPDDDQFEMEDDDKNCLSGVEEEPLPPTRPRAYSEADTIKQSLYAEEAEDDFDEFDAELSRLVVVTPKRQKKDVKSGGGRRQHKVSEPHFRRGAKKELHDDIQSQLYYFYDHEEQPVAEPKIEVKPMPEAKGPEPSTPVETPSKSVPVKNQRRESVSSIKSSSHVSHRLLEPGAFEEKTYLKFRQNCLRERRRLGPGLSQQMNTWYRFLCYYLRDHFNQKMYQEFKTFAIKDFSAGYNYGLQCVFRFLSFGLEKRFSETLLRDFIDLVEYEYHHGKGLYGLEKFVAYLYYRKDKRPLTFSHRFSELLKLYPTLESFPAVRKKRQANKNNFHESVPSSFH
ncbi:hypothetical protein P9112_011247 [Eukaryota sp. TZLM1-RC]